jgi:hypothetical protein
LIAVAQKKEATSQAFRSLPAAQQRSRVREIMESGEPPPDSGANAAGLQPRGYAVSDGCSSEVVSKSGMKGMSNKSLDRSARSQFLKVPPVVGARPVSFVVRHLHLNVSSLYRSEKFALGSWLINSQFGG